MAADGMGEIAQRAARRLRYRVRRLAFLSRPAGGLMALLALMATSQAGRASEALAAPPSMLPTASASVSVATTATISTTTATATATGVPAPRSALTPPSSRDAEWSVRVLNPHWGGLRALAEQGLLVWGSDATVWRRTGGAGGWTAADLPHDGRILQIAASQDGHQLVAVGQRGLLLWSPDGGQRWQVPAWSAEGAFQPFAGRSAGDAEQVWRAVAQQASGFMAVGSGGVVLHSPQAAGPWRPLTGLQAAGDLHQVQAAGGRAWLVLDTQGRLWRSADDGLHWQRQSVLARAAGLRPEPRLGVLVAGSSAPGSVVPELLAATDRGDLWHSRDGGLHWQRHALGRVASGLQGFKALGATQAGAWVGWGASGHCVFRPSWQASWRSCGTGHPALLQEVSSDPSGRWWVAVGERGLLLRSGDHGRHWRRVSVTPTQVSARDLNAVHWDPVRAGFVAAGEGGLLLTSDAQGAHWQAAYSAPAGYVHDLAHTADGGLIAGLSDRTLARSADGGQTWRTHVFEQLHEPAFLFNVLADSQGPGVVVGGGQGAVMVAADGRHWRAQSSGHGVDFLGAQAVPGTRWVMLYGLGGVLQRVDLATGTSERRSLPVADTVYAATADAARGMLYGVGERGLLLHSADQGLHWQSQRVGSTTWRAVGMSPDGSALLLAGDRGVVLRGELGPDGLPRDWLPVVPPDAAATTAAADAEPAPGSGKSPAEAGPAPPLGAWRFVHTDAAGRALWLGGAQGRLWRSVDQGRHWQQVATGTQAGLRPPVYDAVRGRWWLPGRDGVLLRSDDDGLSWQRHWTGTAEHLKGAWVDAETGALLLYGARLVRLTPAATLADRQTPNGG